MTVVNGELYIGTTWGCLIIVEAATMRPITVFRPYEEEVKAILPFQRHNRGTQSAPVSDCDSQSETTTTKQFIVTVGKGYRNLLSRYLRFTKEKTVVHQELNAILWTTQHWSGT